jgi:hypothetical protein
LGSSRLGLPDTRYLIPDNRYPIGDAMRRGAILIIALLVLAACDGTVAVPTPAPTPDIAAEEAAVYTAAIQIYLGGVPDPLVLADQTALDIGRDMTQTLSYVTQHLTGTTSATLADFRARNAHSQPLPPDMALPYRYVLLSATEEKAFFLPNGGGWDAFYQRYPNAQGLMRLSRVGFNATMDQALVYVGNQSNYLAGAGVYYLLRKEDGTWRVVGEVMTWIS